MFISVTTVWGIALVSVDQITVVRPKTRIDPARSSTSSFPTVIVLKGPTHDKDYSSPTLTVKESTEELASRLGVKL